MAKRGSASGSTLTPKTNVVGAKVRFTTGKNAGLEATIITGAGREHCSIELESGVRHYNVPVDRLQLVSDGGGTAKPSKVPSNRSVIMRRMNAHWDF